MSRSTHLFFRVFCTGLFVVLLLPMAHAQVSMMLRNINSPAGGGSAINRGDFNSDGILDVVTANQSTIGGISVYLARADGTFNAPISTSAAPPSTDLALGDFNKDGKLDVAVIGLGFNTVTVLLGNGNGTFQAPISFLLPSGFSVNSITAADFNNDGKLDLAVAEFNTSSSQIQIFEGDGTGHFSLANTLHSSDPSDIRKIRVGDFNRDGKTDIAMLQDFAVSAWFGNGSFTFDQVILQHYGATADLTVVDLNQDNFGDIVISFFTNTSTLEGGVDGFFGKAARSLTLKHLIAPTTNFQAPGETTAADVNGDGINDLVGLDNDSTSADGLYVWFGNANGSFQQTPIRFVYTTDHDTLAMVPGDFNRDGRIDFAAALPSAARLQDLLNATPRAACKTSTVNHSITVCQPQDVTYSHSPLHVVAHGTSSAGVSKIQIFIDNVLKQTASGSSITGNFALSAGTHSLLVKAVDAAGATFTSNLRHVTIFSGTPGQTCATTPSTITLHVCLPAQNASTASPVRIFANAYSGRPLTSIQVFIDNTLKFSDKRASYVNRSFTVGTGSHLIVVKAFDAAGHTVSQSRTITVP